MLNEDQKARLALAQRFRDSADHSLEQQLRDALSRSYYSLYHVGRVLVGKEKGRVGHGELQKDLAGINDIDGELVQTVKELYRLRESADYESDFVTRDFGGDLELFRLKVAETLERGRIAYDRLLGEIRKRTT